jgi:hypothetical protein
MVVGSPLLRYFILKFQERRMQRLGMMVEMVMIRVDTHRQHGGSFLRLAWDLGLQY